MYDTVLPLWTCSHCGLELYTWKAAARAMRVGCPHCGPAATKG